MSRGASLDNREKPIRNLNPATGTSTNLGWGQAGASGSTAYQASGGPCGGGFVRLTFSASGGGGLYSGNGPYKPAVRPAVTYTASAWVRSSKAINLKFTVEQKDSNSAVLSGGTAMFSYASLTANAWTRVSATGVGITNVSLLTMTMYNNGGSWASGDTLDASMAMVTEGGALWDYSDGFTPGWKWDGAVGLSTSVGYPYSVASASGGLVPIASTETQSLIQFAASDQQSSSGASLYLVSETLSKATNPGGAIAYTGAATSPPFHNFISGQGTIESRVQIDTNQASWYFRSNQLDGTPGVAVSSSAADFTLGRNVVSHFVGGGAVRARINGVSKLSGTYTQTTGFALTALDLGSTSQWLNPRGAYLFRGVHTDTQALSIERWLANRYGLTLSI